MNTSPFKKTGLDAMLTPDNCALILIDHQPFQAAAVKNIDVALMINNAVALSKTAKVFGVPTLLTTVIKDRGEISLSKFRTYFRSRCRSTGPSSIRGRTSAASSG